MNEPMPRKPTASRVFGLFKSKRAAEDCFAALRRSGYAAAEVNVMMTDATRGRDFSQEFETRSEARPPIVEGALVGGAIGASLAAVVAVGTSMALPGFGIVVAGPLATVASATAGATAGGLIGALAGFGIGELEAPLYDRAIAAGGVALSVPYRAARDPAALQRLMLKHGGEHVAAY